MRERMGSGGPRGLQILRSGACTRGGFDSHAFPPTLAAALVAAALSAASLLSVAPPVAAQAAPADSVARAAPAGPVERAAPADTAVRRGPQRPRPWTGQPRVVMLRSLLLPGWGQLHNRAWLKAAGVASAEVWLVAAILRDKRDLDALLEEVGAAQAAQDEAGYAEAANRYNARLDTYVGRQWLLGGVLAYALVDAYVDAHFRDFDIEFRNDPALPETPPGEAAARLRGGAARGVRTSLALRWHF